MKSLIITITIALILGRSHSQVSTNPAATAQQSLNDTSINGTAAPVGLNTVTSGSQSLNNTSINGTITPVDLNTTTSGSLYGNGSDVLNTNVNNTASLNSTSATVPLNASVPLNTAAPLNNTVPLNPVPVVDNANSTSLMGNSTTSSNYTSSGSGVFIMNQDIYWENSNFSIYDQNGNLSYQITNQYSGTNMTQKEFVVQDAITGEKKVRIDARVKACGFGQTYEADDGTTFRLDPRLFLPDRWYIKSNSSEYTYKRNAMSLEGKVLENERIVAQVTSRNNFSSTARSTRQLTVRSDGSIPPWDLIALMAVVRTRVHTCGY